MERPDEIHQIRHHAVPQTQLPWESLPYLSTQPVQGRLSLFPQDWVFLLECQVGDGLRRSRGCAQKKESWKRRCIESRKTPQARARVIMNLRNQGDHRECGSEHKERIAIKCGPERRKLPLTLLFVYSIASDTENLSCPELMVMNLNQMEMAFFLSCSVFFNIPELQEHDVSVADGFISL